MGRGEVLLALLVGVTIGWSGLTRASIADYDEDEDVLVLNATNFDTAVAEFKFLFVDFYAPWCGHCKSLFPEFSRASQLLDESNSPIRLAKVDATVEKALAEKYGVKGYPTLLLFRDGDASLPSLCKAGHTAEELLSWLNKKTGTPADRITSVLQAKETIDNGEFVAFGFFTNIDKSAAAKVFIDAADVTEDLMFVMSDSKEVLAEYGIQKDTIVAFKKFDEGRVDLVATAELTVDDVKDFVNVHSLPLAVEFTETNAPRIFSRPIRRHFLFFASRDSSKFEPLLDEFRQVAAQFRGKAIFIYVNVDPDEHKRILEFFGLKRSDCPTYRLVNLDGNVKYKPDTSEPSKDELTKFLQDILSGDRKPFFMSEEIPADWDSKPVKELVGKNFDAVALDKTKDVIVKFYAPWCSHCKLLEPIWNELGETYKDRDDVVVAQLDATANEVDGIKITMFPTVLLFPKDSKDYYEFPNSMNKTHERLVRFIEGRGQLKEALQQPPEDLLERLRPDPKDKTENKDEL